MSARNTNTRTAVKDGNAQNQQGVSATPITKGVEKMSNTNTVNAYGIKTKEQAIEFFKSNRLENITEKQLAQNALFVSLAKQAWHNGFGEQDESAAWRRCALNDARTDIKSLVEGFMACRRYIYTKGVEADRDITALNTPLYLEKIDAVAELLADRQKTHITTDNIIMLSEKVATTTLARNLSRGNGCTIAEYNDKIAKGENPCRVGQYTYLHNIYCELIGDIRRRKATNNGLNVGVVPCFIGDKKVERTVHTLWVPSIGYDIVQEVGQYLQANIGLAKTAPNTEGECTSDGKPCDIMRTAFRKANRFIISERHKQSKTVYLEDYDDGGERLIAVPRKWGFEYALSYKRYIAALESLELSTLQYRFVKLRTEGNTLSECAKALSTTEALLLKEQKHIYTKVVKCEAFKPYVPFLDYALETTIGYEVAAKLRYRANLTKEQERLVSLLQEGKTERQAAQIMGISEVAVWQLRERIIGRIAFKARKDEDMQAYLQVLKNRGWQFAVK